MKRRGLVRHVGAHDCELLRERGRHTVYVHRGNRTISAVPRHQEVNNVLAQRICRHLGVPDRSGS